MLKTSLGLGSKLTTLIISALVLSGCYKIEITETLNLDGTSEITTKVDMSGIDDRLNDLPDSPNLNLENTDDSAEAVTEIYSGCSDSQLLAKYGADNLEGPVTISSTLKVKKSTSCALSEADNFIDITIEETDTETGDIISTQTLERKADSCNAPAILAFYQISDFEEPITEEYTLEKTLEVSCSDTRKEIMINTVTSFSGNDESVTLTEHFKKSAPVVIPDKTQDKTNTPLTNLEDEKEATATDEAHEFCSNIKQDPNEIALFYTGCEDTATDVAVLSFNKFDTTGFRLNSDGTITYHLSSTTQKFNNKLNNNTLQPMDNLSASIMGAKISYTLVSPWPILKYSAGELTDEHTLVLDILKLDETDEITVTLDTDGSTLDLIAPDIQQQIDNLITTLTKRLAAATAPIERQVKYIHQLSGKIQKLATIKLRQKVALGYLQAQLIKLSEDLQFPPVAERETASTDVKTAPKTKAEAEMETVSPKEEIISEPQKETPNDQNPPSNNDEEENLNDTEEPSSQDQETPTDNPIVTE